MVAALEMGYRTLDTALLYGRLGLASAQRRAPSAERRGPCGFERDGVLRQRLCCGYDLLNGDLSWLEWVDKLISHQAC